MSCLVISPCLLIPRKTCRHLYQFTKTRPVWAALADSIQRRRAIPLPQWRSLESLGAHELESSVSQAARIEANFLRERPSARSIFQIINTGRKWGHISWLGQIAGGRYVVIFFRSGVLSVWDVAPEKSGCVATLQTQMDNYTHTCEVLQEEQATLIGLATGAHDTDHTDAGKFSVFKIKFPPVNPGVSITQVLDAKIDIPMTGLFLYQGLAGVVGPFHNRRTAALQVYDWRTGHGILLNTGIDLRTDCDLDVISFPEEIVLYAEDSKQSVIHTYTVDNIRRMLSLVADHEPQTVARVGGGFPALSDNSDSPHTTSDNGSDAPATMQISLPPKRSKIREIKDQGVGTFGAGYTMLKKSHMSARDRIPFGGKMSVLTMSLRELEDNTSRVRCLTHHFVTPLASSASTPSSDSTTSTYLSANSALSSPDEPLDGAPLKHSFAHTLGADAIARGPTGYDLISFGEGGTNVVWLARSDDTNLDSEDEDPEDLEHDEYDKLEYTLYVASFPTSHAERRGEYVRRLKLPRIINPSAIAALDLDDTQGVLCIATTRGEVFRLRFD
ncbi:hypothetical protein FRC08_005629 [Ceratobasidium sp. 394]|nr:hypothetical protein FRC08_005629 [Ceratobasidium sp. 394]